MARRGPPYGPSPFPRGLESTCVDGHHGTRVYESTCTPAYTRGHCAQVRGRGGPTSGSPATARASRAPRPTAIRRAFTTRYRYRRSAITPPPHPTPPGNDPDIATRPKSHVPANDSTSPTSPSARLGKRNQDRGSRPPRSRHLYPTWPLSPRPPHSPSVRSRLSFSCAFPLCLCASFCGRGPSGRAAGVRDGETAPGTVGVGDEVDVP